MPNLPPIGIVLELTGRLAFLDLEAASEIEIERLERRLKDLDDPYFHQVFRHKEEDLCCFILITFDSIHLN